MKLRIPRFLPWVACIAVSMLLAPVAAQAGPGPDLKATKGCQLDPAHGPTAIFCVVNVSNVGTVASVSPVTVVDSPSGPAGTTFTSASGSFGCTTPTGALPATINCGAPYSLVTGTGSGSSGSTFFYFKLPASGGGFKNCVSVSQGQNAATLPDPDLSNNTNICTSINVPGSKAPDLKAEKSCQLDPAHGPTAIFCVINVSNIGSAASVSPVTVVDNPSGPAGTTFTSASGTFGCTTPTGPLPSTINCGAPYSLVTGTGSGSSGSTFLYFKLPPSGGGFKNCVSVTEGQNPGTAGDPNPANNTNICTSIKVPGSSKNAPDLKVTKTCQLDPAHGPTAIFCVINVSNIGTAASVSPVTIVDTVGGSAGTTFTSASGSFGCSTPTGPLPSVINCSAPYSLATGTGSGSSGSTFLYFKLPKGGSFKNCVSVTEGSSSGTPPDPNATNNTNICASIKVP